MRKLMDFVMLWCLFCGAAFGQAANPQNTFANAVNADHPSVWLNFNDPTTAFKDQVSQAAFVTGLQTTLSQPEASYPSPTSVPQTTVMPIALPAGNISSFTIQCGSATAGTGELVLLSFSGLSGTPTASASVTIAATTSPQTFVSGTDFSPIASTAGQYAAFYGESGCEIAYTGGTTNNVYYLAGALPSGASTYTNYAGGALALSVSVTSPSGSVTVQQPGFDNTNPQQFSAEFPFNGFNAAPNNTLGSIEWNVPWTMLIHVDRLNWDRTGQLTLASKGEGNPGWSLILRQDAANANASQLCFYRSGTGEAYSQQHVCTTDNYDAMPNGFGYDIVVEDSGTGAPAALSLWVNGLSGGVAASDSYSAGFGNVVWTVNSGGSGYAATTNFTSTGGGANCIVTGTATATSGVITSVVSPTGYSNSGCTSAPTIVLTSPTGTGANITASVLPMTMNSTTAPLMVPGSRSGGVYYGVGGTDSTQNPVYVDEYAIFPGNLTSAQIANLFATAKFYQTAVDSATPQPVVILEDDTYVDPDNEFTLETTIALHRAGLITLAGVVAEDYTPAGVAGWRQMLDAAGLNDVPVSIPNVSPGTSGYGTGNITAYNASTPLTLSAWGDSTAMYRRVFAKYPTRPIKIIQGSPSYYALATFMQSPADSISSLTGLQMMAQSAAIAGSGIYVQGSIGDTSANGAYVVQNTQGMPLIAIGGTPMSAGPGALVTRTSNDPFYLYLKGVGSDVRQCYDCLTIESAVSSLFDFGVTVAYSGGTGYANATPFTLSGGGPHCQGSGIMTAASGVPNGIEFSWGASVGSGTIGSGCTSQPTVNLIGATGTGVTLTATPSPCGTFVPTLSGSTYSYTFSTTTCSNQYSTPGSFNTDQSPVSGQVMTWFINSLVDATQGGAPRMP